jgi:hypothetical protein
MPDYQIKIGFNPEDRLMTTLGSTLVAARSDGRMFRSEVVNGAQGPAGSRMEIGGTKCDV